MPAHYEIDLTVEPPLTLREATKLPQLRRNGRRPHIASMHRWAAAGIRGIKLETIVVAGSRCTTSAAVNRWIGALTADANGESLSARTPLMRKRAQRHANDILEKAGW
jgi:hypothetical protein